ncbi:MAG: hypothetical protein PHG65_13315 [Kiritimatiellae bacterium]|nr:hypothetical protein [Kiritimatiellia bacterium]
MKRVIVPACRVIFLLVAVGLFGCVSERVGQPAEGSTTLMVSRSGDQAVMQWKSHPDYLYTVVYAPQLSAKTAWQPLPQALRLRGTGRMITVEDRMSHGQSRYYRLNIESAR